MKFLAIVTLALSATVASVFGENLRSNTESGRELAPPPKDIDDDADQVTGRPVLFSPCMFECKLEYQDRICKESSYESDLESACGPIKDDPKEPPCRAKCANLPAGKEKLECLTACALARLAPVPPEKLEPCGIQCQGEDAEDKSECIAECTKAKLEAKRFEDTIVEREIKCNTLCSHNGAISVGGNIGAGECIAECNTMPQMNPEAFCARYVCGSCNLPGVDPVFEWGHEGIIARGSPNGGGRN